MSLLSLTAALWFATDPAASRVDVSGGVSVEVRGGRAPRQPQADPEPAILTIVTPDVDMEVASRRGTTFNLGYTPRAQYRYPNRIGINRPLLLHQGYANLQQQLNRRWLLGANLGGSIGEADYNSAPVVLEDNTQAPEAELLEIAAASAGLNLAGRLTRRHTLGIQGNAVYRTPIGISRTPVTDEMGETVQPRGVPEQFNVSAGVSLETRVTPIDAVDVSLTPGYFDYNRGGTQYFTTQALAQWRRELRPSLSGSVGAGLFGSFGIGDTNTNEVLPVGLAALTGGLVRRASHNVDATISAGITPYFDRVRTELAPRATLNGTILVSLPPRWSVRVMAGGVTNATRDPRPPTSGANQDPEMMTDVRLATETQVRLGVPVTYQINDEQQVEFGLLMSARAPHLRAEPFEFNQGEMWFYVAYRIGAGTARGGREVGQASGGALTRSARGGADSSGGGRR
jgi:hypothetical protein